MLFYVGRNWSACGYWSENAIFVSEKGKKQIFVTIMSANSIIFILPSTKDVMGFFFVVQRPLFQNKSSADQICIISDNNYFWKIKTYNTI